MPVEEDCAAASSAISRAAALGFDAHWADRRLASELVIDVAYSPQSDFADELNQQQRFWDRISQVTRSIVSKPCPRWDESDIVARRAQMHAALKTLRDEIPQRDHDRVKLPAAGELS